MSVPAPRTAAIVAAVASALALGGAMATERFMGLVPCALCLWERWPYRVALAVGLLAVVWRTGRRTLVVLMALVLLAAAGLGAVHVGVEHALWPSPLPECAAPSLGSGSMADRLARMPALPSKPCDEPTYLVPGLPLSMALMNTLLALALTVFLAISAARTRRPA